MSIFRRILRQWRWFVAAALAVIVLPVVVSLALPKQAARILPLDPQVVSQPLPVNCLPDRVPGISNPSNQLSFALTARVLADGNEYRLYQVSRKQQPNDAGFEHLVQIVNGQCRRLATNAMGNDNLYFHRIVSIPIARQLALARLQQAVSKVGGAQAFQARLSERFRQLPQGEIVPIPEEEAWALEQLQITLPANVRVVPAPPRSGGS
ncbi:hypothetical protein ACQ4M3_07540 [Leptolyngbya sp. AN03gr2]|uniref:hypothetical protein n=1 Tax=unclassified Leptolyngbya TaxID=2650499 RepID=UPI003D314415